MNRYVVVRSMNSFSTFSPQTKVLFPGIIPYYSSMIHYFGGEPWETDYVRAKLPNENIVFHDGSIAAHPDAADSNASMLCIFVEAHVGEDELKRFPAVKLIATRSTGFDHIDLVATKARGITVVNARSEERRVGKECRS